MEIPRSLNTTWNKIASDGVIEQNANKGEVQELFKAAVKGTDNQGNLIIGDEENAFLKQFSEEFSTKSNNTGKVPASAFNFIESSNNNNGSDLNNLIENFDNSFSRFLKSDNKLTGDELESLRLILSQIEQASNNSGGSEAEVQRVQETLKGVYETFNSLGVSEMATFNKAEVPQHLQDMWTKLVDSDGVLDTNDFKSMLDINKDSGYSENEQNFFKKASQVANQQVISFVDDEDQKTSSNNVNSNSNVPHLEQAFNQLTADGKLSLEDFQSLVSIGAPSLENATTEAEADAIISQELDENEQAFLGKYSEHFNNSADPLNDPVILQKNNSSASTSGKKTVMLMQWTGYNAENKAALKDSFPELMRGSSRMPILDSAYATGIAEAIVGEGGSIADLQKEIGAKPDGKFGPETYFKVKLYLSNAVNNPDTAVETKKSIASLLNDLGQNDPHVIGLKEVIANQLSTTTVVDNTNTNVDVNSNNNGAVGEFTQEIGKLVDINNKNDVAKFQSKLNVLASLTGQPINVPVDGKVDSNFETSLQQFSEVVGYPAGSVVEHIENELQTKLGMSELNDKTSRFINFQAAGPGEKPFFHLIGITSSENITADDIRKSQKEVLRIEATKQLLEALDINIGKYDIQFPENAVDGGNVRLVNESTGLNIGVYQYALTNQADSKGDLLIEGTIGGKPVSVSYWEDLMRKDGDKISEKLSLSENKLFLLKYNIDGQEDLVGTNESGIINIDGQLRPIFLNMN